MRSRAAYESVRGRSAKAAREALEQAELGPQDGDVRVTTHTTSWTIPGLDVDPVGWLGLRPDVERIGPATAACAGGGHALVHATQALRGRPGEAGLAGGRRGPVHALPPGPELPTMQDVLYGGLFGDSAGAAVVSAVEEAEAGDLVVEDVWEMVPPDSSRAYGGVVHEGGISFDSGKEATTAPQRVTPDLTERLDGRPVEWAAVHPGGPGVISATLTGLGLDAATAGRHARDSLTGGNPGGVALLDVPARTMTDGAVEGLGVAVAYGPGFTAAGLCLRAVRSGAAGRGRSAGPGRA